MDNTNNPALVVITEKKRRGGLVWIALTVLALLLGGSTFALWSANDVFQGGSITTGDLNLVKTADTTFYDVSADRTDATIPVPGTGTGAVPDDSLMGHAITDSTWRMVPGDKAAAVFATTLTLNGDNLVGKLSLDGLSLTQGTNSLVNWSYQVFRAGVPLAAEQALPSGASGEATLIYLSAPGTGQGGQEDADGTTVYSMANTTESFTVVLYAALDANTSDRDGVNITDQLTSVTLKLEQVRDTGAIFS